MTIKLVVSSIVVWTILYLANCVICLLWMLLYIYIILVGAINTVRHYGVLLWNSLTDDICITNSSTLFKKIWSPTYLLNIENVFLVSNFMSITLNFLYYYAYLVFCYLAAVFSFLCKWKFSYITGCCGVVGSTLTFGSIGHGFESEHHLFSYHSTSVFRQLKSLA